MPQFDVPYQRRYNTLRLLGYEYNSPFQLCAISLVTDLRRSLFADVNMAKSVLKCLLSSETLDKMRLRAFTLMPNHLHFLAGVRQPDTSPTHSSIPTQAFYINSSTFVGAALRGRLLVTEHFRKECR